MPMSTDAVVDLFRRAGFGGPVGRRMRKWLSMAERSGAHTLYAVVAQWPPDRRTAAARELRAIIDIRDARRIAGGPLQREDDWWM